MNKNLKNLFLVRHGAYSGSGDAHLSSHGEQQAKELAQKIKGKLNGNSGELIIWTSAANRAIETAVILDRELGVKKRMRIETKLWSDNDHSEDFDWLAEELNNFTGENLLIVSHLEYVRDFPRELGFPRNDAEYAEGVFISEGRCNFLGS